MFLDFTETSILPTYIMSFHFSMSLLTGSTVVNDWLANTFNGCQGSKIMMAKGEQKGDQIRQTCLQIHWYVPLRRGNWNAGEIVLKYLRYDGLFC